MDETNTVHTAEPATTVSPAADPPLPSDRAPVADQAAEPSLVAGSPPTVERATAAEASDEADPSSAASAAALADLTAALAALNDRLHVAVAEVRDLTRALHPDAVVELIDGPSVEEIRASIGPALAAAEGLRQREQRRQEAPGAPAMPGVPAGHAARTEPVNLAGLEAEDKIAAGLRLMAVRS